MSKRTSISSWLFSDTNASVPENHQEPSENTCQSPNDDTALLIGFNDPQKMILIRAENLKLASDVSYFLSLVPQEGSAESVKEIVCVEPQEVDVKEVIPEDNLPLKKKAKMKGTEFDLGNNCDGCPIKNEKKSIIDGNDKGEELKCDYCMNFDDSDDSYLSDNTESESVNFNSLKDMLNKMLEKDIIDQAFFNLIELGLLEMKSDIFAEMLEGEKNITDTFSNELMAFALLLHFKRRPAYNFFKRVFPRGWPSHKKVKDWKALVNKNKTKRKNKWKKRK